MLFRYRQSSTLFLLLFNQHLLLRVSDYESKILTKDGLHRVGGSVANRIDSHFNFKVVSLSSFASSLPFPLSLIYDYGKINQLLVELAQKTHAPNTQITKRLNQKLMAIRRF